MNASTGISIATTTSIRILYCPDNDYIIALYRQEWIHRSCRCCRLFNFVLFMKNINLHHVFTCFHLLPSCCHTVATLRSTGTMRYFDVCCHCCHQISQKLQRKKYFLKYFRKISSINATCVLRKKWQQWQQWQHLFL